MVKVGGGDGLWPRELFDRRLVFGRDSSARAGCGLGWLSWSAVGSLLGQMAERIVNSGGGDLLG